MGKYGYIRVSTKDQNPDRQIDALLGEGISRNHIYTDRQSGKDFERPEYKRLMRKLKHGDLLVVKSIDRLGRNYDEILKQWRVLTQEKRVDIEVLDFPLLNTNTRSDGLSRVFISDLVLQILAYVAETERTFIRKRQAEGIASAQSRGVKFGRERIPMPAEFIEYVQRWRKGEITMKQAAEALNISPSTFCRRCHELLDALGGQGFQLGNILDENLAFSLRANHIDQGIYGRCHYMYLCEKLLQIICADLYKF